jgi:hypothetical protein
MGLGVNIWQRDVLFPVPLGELGLRRRDPVRWYGAAGVVAGDRRAAGQKEMVRLSEAGGGEEPFVGTEPDGAHVAALRGR